MASKHITSISVGKALHAMCQGCEEYQLGAAPWYPIMRNGEGSLPYVTYRRAATEPTYHKGTGPAEKVTVELSIYTGRYDNSVDYAENLRHVIENYGYTPDGPEDLGIRSSRLVDASEDVQGDAYVQSLTFEVSTTKTT